MNIFITGASRGLGYELTKASLQGGHNVIAGVRNITGQLQLLTEQFPGQLTLVTLDVTSEENLRTLSETLKQKQIPLHAIINNAGILLGRGQTIETLSLEEVKLTYDINVIGPMNVIKHLLPMMSRESRGVIINVSSEAGSITNAYGGDFSYATSKTALNMYTKQLRSYLGETMIRVFAIHPGWMKTEMGGDQAPGDPKESASDILSIVEGKTTIPNDSFFVDTKGQNMPI
ncbi:SDR family oxidoreductase [Bacillus alkalicellulosilyticus]|uniref:SDR family oxidoreductase n=1 Tax=Alkalihalobacterium alkalicellulosilyticum TaxID=1912214 RepID=UPI000996D568|nr:SDR family oxidoreductase [Bacillus alkalicellulosilyticus]